MVRELTLTDGSVALLDDEDLPRVLQLGDMWANEGGYAARQKRFGGRKGKAVRYWMHRVVLRDVPAYPVAEVDHINGNKLDNRKANLRVVTKRENMQHRPKLKREGFKGAYFDDSCRVLKKWRAMIRVDGKLLRLGRYATPEEAARAYDAAAREHFGEYAYTNFKEVVNG